MQNSNASLKMRKFLVRGPAPSTFEKTWEYFEGAFGMAFDMLTKTALAHWSSSLTVPPEPLIVYFPIRPAASFDHVEIFNIGRLWHSPRDEEPHHL